MDPEGSMLPECRRSALVLTGISAASALLGGALLIAFPQGGTLLPLALLEPTPFASFLVPGILLAGVIGGTSALAFVLTARRSSFDLDAEILAGGALLVWIVVEVALLRTIHWLHVAFGVLGLMILAQATRNALRSRVWRHHWIAIVTWGETLGYLAPAATAILLTARGVEGWPLVAALAAAGLVEGTVLGAAQARALPFTIDRARFALLTAVGAAIVWASVMSLTQLGTTLPPAILIPIAIPIGAVALVAIGGAQWLELRRHRAIGRRALRWIPWTAAAWTAALPLSFLASPFVDETTPIAANLALWASAGALMAYAMALVTWRGVRSIETPAGASERSRWGRQGMEKKDAGPAGPWTPSGR